MILEGNRNKPCVHITDFSLGAHLSPCEAADTDLDQRPLNLEQPTADRLVIGTGIKGSPFIT